MWLHAALIGERNEKTFLRVTVDRTVGEFNKAFVELNSGFMS